ncbi:MAG: tetratricopeptide repeat protein [Amphiplicatus sp.]
MKSITSMLLAAVSVAAFVSAAPSIAAPSGGGSLPSQQVDPAEAYREGVEALQAEDYKKAEKKFGEVLEVAPKNPEANYFMGVAKVARGKTKSSVRYFEKAIKERPNFTEAREQLALVQIELGDRESAGAQLDALKAQTAACENEECGAAYAERLVLAVSRVEAALAAPQDQSGKEGAEEEDGDEVSQSNDPTRLAGLFLESGDVGADQYRQAVRLINEAHYEAAIVDLYHAQAATGPHPDILNYLGYANRKLGRIEQAQDYYAQALAIDPDHLGANEYLGELYLEINEIEKARRQLAKLDALCAFGCAEREDLARLIEIKESLRRASR